MAIETVTHSSLTLAIIIRKDFSEPGIKFFTPASYSQQLAYMRHPSGKMIQPHVHKPVHRDVDHTQEVLFLKSGKLRVDFYDENHHYLESRLLVGGDIILLASGGHGFEVIEEIEMYEVKQGPYVEGDDKIKFDGVSEILINLKNDEA